MLQKKYPVHDHVVSFSSKASPPKYQPKTGTMLALSWY
jgi:hypothetical protein